MKRLCLVVLLAFACFSAAYAQDFVLYDNPFVSGRFPEVAPDGTLWFRAGQASVVNFDPSSGLQLTPTGAYGRRPITELTISLRA